MSANVVSQYVIDFEDGPSALVEAQEAERLLGSRLADPDSLPLRVSVRDIQTDDTEGHALSAALVRVTVDIDDDTEGHALTLRFPSAEAARTFQKRLLTTTVLVGVVGAAAVGIEIGQGVQAHAAPVSAPAAAVAAPWHDTDKLAPAVAVPLRDTDKLQPMAAAPSRDTDKLDQVTSSTSDVPQGRTAR